MMTIFMEWMLTYPYLHKSNINIHKYLIKSAIIFSNKSNKNIRMQKGLE